MAKSADIPIAAQVLLSFVLGIPSSLIAAYIYDKLRKTQGKIRISGDRRKIETAPEGITKLIESHIKIEEEDQQSIQRAKIRNLGVN